MPAPAANLPADPLSSPTAAGLTRRTALTTLGALGAAAAVSRPAGAHPHDGADAPAIPGWDATKGEYVLPPLPYEFKALEPHIDAETMEIHHDRHHAAYVRGANKALAELAKIRSGEGDATLVKHWSRELAFHGSGHVNHTIFWLTMAPKDKGGGGRPGGELAKAIDRDFGSYDAFSTHFQAAANQVEGGGWAWLAHEHVSGKLLVLQTEKQQDLTMSGVQPLLGVDVWEHAYYLKYKNNRAEYVKAFMNVIDWAAVDRVHAMWGRVM